MSWPPERYVVLVRESRRSRSTPNGTRILAEGDELEELLEPIAEKAGVRVTVEPIEPTDPRGASD
jgi:hypothetical protein